jgi:glycosyltransferase involved in cell wall biosynthesis
MLTIGYDRQTFAIQAYGGVSRYFSDLYGGLSSSESIKAIALFRYHQNNYLRQYFRGKKLNASLARKYERFMLNWSPPVPISTEVDIHHATFYLGVPWKSKKSGLLVSTLYDMTPEIHTSFFPKGNPHKNKLEWLRKSDLIISISDSAKNDLLMLYPELSGKVQTIHLSSGFGPDMPAIMPEAISSLHGPYLLIVGKRGGYKNVWPLIECFAKSNLARKGFNLLLAGGGKISEKECSRLHSLSINNHVYQLAPSDPELWCLYQNASAILVPSLAEGFSLPLVEALYANTPIICSEIPVHKEVAGDFSVLIKPGHINDWIDALNTVESIQTPKELLGAKYNPRRLYFSKSRMVDDHISAYQKLGRQALS